MQRHKKMSLKYPMCGHELLILLFVFLPQVLYIMTAANLFGERTVDRKTAVALFKELCDKEFFEPFMVVVEQRDTDNYQLMVKGEYDVQQIELFLKGRGFSLEVYKNYLIIFKE